MKKIAVIGGGASGAIAAISLLTEFGSRIEILIFEPRSNLGEGIAYAHRVSSLILNVPLEKMSATNDPLGFKTWCLNRDPTLARSKDYPFVPRYLYGEYLRDTLTQLEKEKNNKIIHVRDQVARVRFQTGFWYVESSGHQHKVDNVIVATGLHAQITPPTRFQNTHVMQAHDLKDFEKIRSSDRILIIGSNLTAIDCWRHLRSLGYAGQITFASRKAHFPMAHDLNAKPFQLPNLVGTSPRKILSIIRSIHESNKISFVQLADALRLQVPDIWSGWSTPAKRQFLRHLKHYWKIIRHRIPMQVAAALKSELAQHKIQVRRIETIVPSDYNVVIVATGYAIEQKNLRIEAPTVMEPCQLGLGWGSPGGYGLWFVGPASKSQYWEITSVPDIRIQTETIVRAIAHSMLDFRRKSG